MSFLNNLRRMAGLKAKDEDQTPKVKAEVGPEAFKKLCEQFYASESNQEKAEIWKQMRKVLPQTLFLAPMCYEGENPNQQFNDRELHASTGARRRFAVCRAVVTNGNPGYSLATKSDRRRTHLITMVYNKTKEEWVPLFTDFTKLLPVFGQKYRVMVISFDEAKLIAKPYKGIVINPGPQGLHLNAADLKKVI